MTIAAYRLPIPPSANKLWRVYQGRAIKSADYRAWLVDASVEILKQGRKRVPSPFVVRIVIVGGKDWNVRRDIDNAIKPLVDLLCHALVIEKDSSRHMIGVAANFESRDVATSWCCIEVETVEETS